MTLAQVDQILDGGSPDQIDLTILSHTKKLEVNKGAGVVLTSSYQQNDTR